MLGVKAVDIEPSLRLQILTTNLANTFCLKQGIFAESIFFILLNLKVTAWFGFSLLKFFIACKKQQQQQKQK